MKKSVIMMIVLLLMGVVFMGVGSKEKSVFAAESTGSQVGTIVVQGMGEVTAEPDAAFLSFGVETSGQDVAEAQRENARTMDAVLGVLDGLAIEKGHIKTTEFSVSPRYEYQGGVSKKIGYQVQNMIRIRLEDLTKSGELIDAVTAAGANLFHGIEFSVSDKSPYYLDALKSALTSACQKAELIAATQGIELGKTLSVEENAGNDIAVYPVQARAAVMMDASAATPVAAGKLTVKAVVTVVYAIAE